MEIRDRIEQTLLSAAATRADVERTCDEAVRHRFFGVCISPHWARLAAERLHGSALRVVTVAGFPLGTSRSDVKAREAELAVEDGAHEIDVVISLGDAIAGDFAAVREDLAIVRRAVPGAALKAILETGHFDEARLSELAECAIDAGVDFLKTSTGMGPRGATVDDVRLLVRIARGRAGVKAAGGIRTAEDAGRMIDAGADRIGTSRGGEIVGERIARAGTPPED